MKIRPYRKEDCHNIKKFISEILQNIFKSPAKALEDLDNIKKNFDKFWIATEDNKIIGTIGIKNEQGKARISRMYISKDYRRKGLGKKLMSLALNYCKNNYKEGFLSTYKQMNSVDFYKKMGFSITKESGDVITMELKN